MSAPDHHDEYGETFVAGLEWMWGEGYLSPGGEAEVARIIAGVPIGGARVLDIGCGLGAVDILLVERFRAAHVTGVDVEAPLVAKAAARVEAAGLADRISIRKVSPGPFPFEDDTFDVVFSKDSMIHIPDKRALYEDIHRVLAPGGWMAVSDWFGNGLEPTPAMRTWLDVVGLTLRLESIETSAALVEMCGFTGVEWHDRNVWYAEAVRDELATLTGDNHPRLVAHLGPEAAAQRLESTAKKKVVVDGGELRPGHLRARKPA
ncbi:MAG: methyltransferase domain-containing protein [Thiotrichales bacterium]|nr:methyltransferase domain-containing protein [Thiotrichales bacterium]